MVETTLYSIACEMLRETNPYKRNVDEISYHLQGEKITLLDIVDKKLSGYHKGNRNYSKNNLLIAYNAIEEAMEDYLYRYHSSYSFKRNTRIKFHSWLKSIQVRYELGDIETPFEDDIQSKDQDSCIVLLKALHPREGVSEFGVPGMKPRTVRQNLRKLSPDLYKGSRVDIQKEPEYVPFRIGGQQVAVTVKSKKRPHDRTQYYYTPNTLHPIVLQENMMQVGLLLKSLCRSYYDPQSQSELALLISIDIWSQLSNYARGKIKNIYTIGDVDFKDFVDILDDECPNDYASTYRTEREIAEKEGLSIEEAIIFLAKASERTATLTIRKNDTLIYISGARIIHLGGNCIVVVDAENIEHQIVIEHIEDIDID